MILNESDVAAVIVEPIVGTNGVIVPPDEYLPKLRRICTENNVLLIADEVMSGWGRSGKWFAVDHWGVQPRHPHPRPRASLRLTCRSACARPPKRSAPTSRVTSSRSATPTRPTP